MSQNFRVIDGVSVTSTEVRCPGCGGTIGVKFDPETATLECPFCGLSSKLPAPENGAAAQELDFNSALQRASVDWGRLKKVVVCSNCGGQTLYDAEQITGACPFCGSTSVAQAAENEHIMAPNAVIPFSITKEQCQQIFVGYLKRSSMVYKKAYECKLENLTGIYLPFWTFDAYSVSSFVASAGSDAPEGVKYIQGVYNQYIDDIPIYASKKFRSPYMAKVMDYKFEQAVPYSPEYLAGIPAERYTVGLNESWERARVQTDKDIRRALEYKNKVILYVTRLITRFYNVKFRYLLAPMYFATYTFGKKTYQVIINGQTGKTIFPVPRYLTKMIILAVIAGIFILVIFFGLTYLFPDSPLLWMYRLLN